MSSSPAEAAFRAAIARMDPADRVEAALRASPVAGPVTLLALGKAAVAMARGAVRALGDAVADVVIVAPHGSDPGPFQVFTAGHPVPDDRSRAAADKLLEAAAAADPGGHIVALISGGGSALACAPTAGLALKEKNACLDAVYRSGADIRELNIVRAALSRIKGGGLAGAAAAPVRTLIASDVVGDDPAVVASGPTAGRVETERALQIVKDRVGAGRFPAAESALRARRAGDHARRLGDRVEVVAGLGAMADAVARELVDLGFAIARLDPQVSGDVDAVAEQLSAEALSLSPGEALVWAGEVTIAVPADAGNGGRAHHLALRCARAIAGAPAVHILAAGTDGIDGSASAAGAVVDGNTAAALAAAGVDASLALSRFDTAPAFARIGCAVVTGATGINHADLYVALVPPTER